MPRIDPGLKLRFGALLQSMACQFWLQEGRRRGGTRFRTACSHCLTTAIFGLLPSCYPNQFIVYSYVIPLDFIHML